MPVEVMEKLDHMRSDFLWEGQAKRKMHLMKMSKVLKPKKEKLKSRLHLSKNGKLVSEVENPYHRTFIFNR